MTLAPEASRTRAATNRARRTSGAHEQKQKRRTPKRGKESKPEQRPFSDTDIGQTDPAGFPKPEQRPETATLRKTGDRQILMVFK